jgi:hypothetical protein
MGPDHKAALVVGAASRTEFTSGQGALVAARKTIVGQMTVPGPPLTFLAFPLRSIGRLRMQRLKGLEAQMKLKPDRQLSLTDPE